MTPVTALTIGGYYAIKEGHQLFLSYDMSFNHRHLDGERETDIGGIALGYNAMLTDTIELITEINFDITQDDEDFGADFLVGFITTLPSAAD